MGWVVCLLVFLRGGYFAASLEGFEELEGFEVPFDADFWGV